MQRFVETDQGIIHKTSQIWTEHIPKNIVTLPKGKVLHSFSLSNIKDLSLNPHTCPYLGVHVIWMWFATVGDRRHNGVIFTGLLGRFDSALGLQFCDMCPWK